MPVIGGALAAVTSFLLSAKIGLGGSVIGVAVGSVVSAVSSQLYQNVLKVSGQKIQEKVEWVGGPDDAEPQETRKPRVAGGSGAAAMAATRAMSPVVMHSDAVEDMAASDGGTSVMRPVADGGTQVIPTVAQQAAGTKPDDSDGSTRVMPAIPVAGSSSDDATDGATSVMPAVAGEKPALAGTGDSSTPVSFAPRSHASGAASKETIHHAGKTSGVDAKTRRKALVITIAAALLAVGVTSGIILALTGGQGTDDVVKRNLPKSVQTTQTTTPSPQQTQSVAPSPQQTATGESTTQDNGSGTTNGTGDDSTGTGSDTGTGESGTTTNNGSGTSGSGSGTSGSTSTGGTTNNGSGTSGSTGSGSGTSGTDSGTSGTTGGTTGGTDSGSTSTGGTTGGANGSGTNGSAN
ncbi:hypothetical protein KIH77_03525 [Bifidobacterium sp. 82T24]|uniref:hypothetical protein n=1 Tax=Bifidobacterium pluvialisilvae TaxID=2834436 RepID=UPI001C560C3D|nr:hypothetical protein [Bifidobacterium pluvialisilvae]MBW3087805.1 hypothetical protein [Bifidobacterium pluvialisilvae]